MRLSGNANDISQISLWMSTSPFLRYCLAIGNLPCILFLPQQSLQWKQQVVRKFHYGLKQKYSINMLSDHLQRFMTWLRDFGVLQNVDTFKHCVVNLVGDILFCKTPKYCHNSHVLILLGNIKSKPYYVVLIITYTAVFLLQK